MRYETHTNGYSNGRRGHNNIVKLDPEDSQNFDKTLAIPQLFVHAYILAMSGVGKTEIIKNLIIRFYLEKMSNSIIIDLDGDLSRQIARVIADKKAVVYIDMMSPKKFTSIYNPFRIKHQDMVSLSIMSQELLIAIASIIGADFSPNMEAILIPCIYVLLIKGDSGIDELMLFMDDKNNKYLIELGLKSPIPTHRKFFEQQFSKSKFKITKDAIATKLQILLNNPLFANFIIGKSTLNLEKLMASKGKIIIFRFPKSMISAAKLLMASIQGIALKRVKIPELEMRPKTYLFLDEFQNFVNPTLQEMLSGTRKYNLSVICANQKLSDIDTKTKDGLLTNAHIKIVGKCSYKDAKTMADELSLDTQQLMELQKGEFYTKVDSNMPIKVMATDRYLGDREALPDMYWKKHLKYWRKKYATKIIDATVVESIDDKVVDNSTPSLPIPKFDMEG